MYLLIFKHLLDKIVVGGNFERLNNLLKSNNIINQLKSKRPLKMKQKEKEKKSNQTKNPTKNKTMKPRTKTPKKNNHITIPK